MQNRKAPGPDGFPVEFYETFAPRLAPILRLLFQEISTDRKLPSTMTQATISVLLKKGRDPLDCGSYRPFSLLCCDYKILTKVLSRHLETVTPKIINYDHTGFIPGRQSFYNMRRFFNVIYSTHSTQQAEIVLSLDAEKAFDWVEWEYLFTVLDKFGFGPAFTSLEDIIYITSGLSAYKFHQI